jgi:hypothetical protein
VSPQELAYLYTPLPEGPVDPPDTIARPKPITPLSVVVGQNADLGRRHVDAS